MNAIVRQSRAALVLALFTAGVCAQPQPAQKAPTYEPQSGQEGKDVVWVPTPQVLVDRMLNMAKVTANDFVMDLGSGDGRTVITAAKRGARAVGVEYNPDMVELSKRAAEKAGVADKAQFVQGDMYVADISRATVLALFLLPENMNKLVDKFLALKPGSRIVANQFAVTGWTPDETGRADGDCGSWCTWLLYIVPAPVAGRWQFESGELQLEQQFQAFNGTYTVNGASTLVTDGRLRGDEISFTAGGRQYRGKVNAGAMTGSDWKAKRVQ